MSLLAGSSVLNDVYDSATHTLKIAGGGAIPVGLATEAKQDDSIALLTTIDASAGTLTAVDYATETTQATLALEAGGNLATLAAVDFATETTQASLALETGGNLATLAAVDYATETTQATLALEAGGNLATLAAIDFATETGGNLATIASNTTPGTPQTGTDATGADAYATIVTAAAAKSHIMVTNLGRFGAIISLNGGTTDHLIFPGASGGTLDSIVIANGAAVQAKNQTAGSNYTNLTVTIW